MSVLRIMWCGCEVALRKYPESIINLQKVRLQTVNSENKYLEVLTYIP